MNGSLGDQSVGAGCCDRGEPEAEKLGGLACEEGFHGDSGNGEGLTLGPPG